MGLLLRGTLESQTHQNHQFTISWDEVLLWSYGNSHGWVLPAIKHHCAIDRLDASSIPCGCDVLLSNLLKGHHDWCCLRRIFAEYSVGSPATPGLEVCLKYCHMSHSVKRRRIISNLNYYISHEILRVQDKKPHWSFLGRFRFKQAFQLSSHVPYWKNLT